VTDENVFTALCIIAFFLGVILIISGFADLGVAIRPENFMSDLLESLSRGGTGALKITVGLVLIIAVIAPNSLRVIFRR